MVDRQTRDKLIAEIEAFLDRRISAFEFDKRLDALGSADYTVDWVVGEVWCFYDDLTDHSCDLLPVGWNYFQRLLLLLRSDCELVPEPACRNGSRLVSVLPLAGLACVYHGCGWISLPFGLVWLVGFAASLGMFYRLRRQEKARWVPTLFPFQSYAEIAALRRASMVCKKRHVSVPAGTLRWWNRSWHISSIPLIPEMAIYTVVFFLCWPLRELFVLLGGEEERVRVMRSLTASPVR